MSVAELLADLAAIGLNPVTGGYRRFSWTDTDLAMRQWFAMQAEARHLDLLTDRNGNLWAFLGDPRLGEVVATGSHFDSVPEGGPFDGPLGIASSFAALDLLRDRGLRQQRPLAIVAFTEEEGARFGVSCLGSRLFAGMIDPERASALTDADGITLIQAMANAGADSRTIGPDPERLSQLSYFVELHVEQGRTLADFGQSVGVGSGIWPHGRWRLEFEGRADHAGTTRMEDRDDPMTAFASTVLRVTEEAIRLGARSTFGRVQVTPNATNAIASQVTAWLDARAERQQTLDQLLESIGPSTKVSSESLTRTVEFDNELIDRAFKLLDGPPVLATAAGHDAGILSLAGVPTTMLFVRNQTGTSHAPAEYATPADCQSGVESLATLLADLAGFR